MKILHHRRDDTDDDDEGDYGFRPLREGSETRRRQERLVVRQGLRRNPEVSCAQASLVFKICLLAGN